MNETKPFSTKRFRRPILIEFEYYIESNSGALVGYPPVI